MPTCTEDCNIFLITLITLYLMNIFLLINIFLFYLGGVGLNLNCANHMILMDPAWNPSTEDQCFDRVHRLGQTKDVEIVRFTMKDRYIIFFIIHF